MGEPSAGQDSNQKTMAEMQSLQGWTIKIMIRFKMGASDQSMTEIQQEKALKAEPQPMEAAELLVAYLEQIGVEFCIRCTRWRNRAAIQTRSRRSARRGGPRPVVARHEAGAAFMADGYTRESARSGCAAPLPARVPPISSPAVACAYENEIPMLVITGQPSLRLLGRGAFAGIIRRRHRHSRDVSHLHTLQCADIPPDQMERQLTNALLSAHHPTPGPVHLSIPVDVLRSMMNGVPAYDMAHLLQPLSAVDDASVRELQAQLAQTKKVVVLIGGGCGDAMTSSSSLVERMGGVFRCRTRRQGFISPRHPLYRGRVRLRRPPVRSCRDGGCGC